MPKFYLVGEGHGEVRAGLNLVTRLWRDLLLPNAAWHDPPIRGIALHTEQGFRKTCTLLRSKSDCCGALILRDEDDGCPASRGPEAARWLVEARLPFPVAVVLAHREYEAWFLPCVHLMAGKTLAGPAGDRAGVVAGASFSGDPEGIRDVKGWLSRHYGEGQAYKPTLDQLALTRLVDFNVIRRSGMPSFGTLERAIRFLAAGDRMSNVYPLPRVQSGSASHRD